ncbi:hypothetical protein SAMN06893096_101358 [Geodermatophilus pulveris]|uniref:Uncharacterized protein n=1 Tax=Geodermatophilus pulveris TaxID=1564159 RepID=A0A239B1F2_9ACTN|nr:hypothetical protein [Geodermatophilus pulveris]SNS01402.1 hypothetical protein SAMN06893096_101358 [Geodermatophilus pulveris]
MPRNTRRRRRPTLLLVTLLLVAGALGLWTRTGDTVPAAAGTAPAAPSAGAPTPSAPTATAPTSATRDEPTGEEPGDDAARTAAQTTARTTAQPTAPTAPDGEQAAGPAAAAVALTYAGYDAAVGAVVAGGYAADVVEVDATCTLALSRDGVELRGEALGTPSAATTDCGEVRVGGDALTPGTWQAVLVYTSATSAGESAAVEVEVP